MEPNGNYNGKPINASAGIPDGSPTHAEIAAKAYELWLEEGEPLDSAERNWFEAERELRVVAGLNGLGVKSEGQLTRQRLGRRQAS